MVTQRDRGMSPASNTIFLDEVWMGGKLVERIYWRSYKDSFNCMTCGTFSGIRRLQQRAPNGHGNFSLGELLLDQLIGRDRLQSNQVLILGKLFVDQK